MKYYFLTLILASVAVAAAGCEQVKSSKKEQTNPEPAAGKEPVTAPEAVATTDNEPLLLEEEPLLPDDEHLSLLEDGLDEDSSTESMADNNRCFVCHINYMDEDIAVTHARVNIGCANCHGDSDEHIADESWASGGNGTAPDIMYPLSKINSFCMGCHTRETIDTEQHKPLLVDNNNEKYCTDCHGEHRLTNRKCKWK